MALSRNLATPLAAMGLVLMATTGLGMFFHLDSELSKELHEWGGWAFLAGVLLHVSANLEAFKRHLSRPMVLGGLLLALAVAVGSFFVGEKEDHDKHDHDPHDEAHAMTVEQAPARGTRLG